MFTSGYVNTETILHFFIINSVDKAKLSCYTPSNAATQFFPLLNKEQVNNDGHFLSHEVIG